MDFSKLEYATKINSDCVFSFMKKNDIPELILNRRPMKLHYPWSFLDNKRMYFDDNVIHASLTLSPNMELNKNIFSRLSFITILKIDETKIPSLENFKLKYNNIEEAISLTKKDYENIFLSNDVKDKEIRKYIDKVNEASKIRIISQGSENLNGVLDAYISYIKLADEFYGSLNIKVYYNVKDDHSIASQKLTIPLNGEFINDYEILSVSIDSDNSTIKVFKGFDFFGSTNMNPIQTYKNVLNYPFNDNDENMHLKIGNEFVDIKYFSIFENTISPLYLKQIF